MLNWLCLYFFSTLERCFSHSFKKRKTEIIVTIVISLLDLKVFKWCFVFLTLFQAAQAVLIALFQLNTPEFTMLLAALPKTFQDGATKLLQNHLKNTGSVAQVSSKQSVRSRNNAKL